MKHLIVQLKERMPESAYGKKITLLIGLLFLILPFQTPLLHKTCKNLSLSILPLDLPAYFPNRIAFFPSEFILLGLLVFFRKNLLSFFWLGPSKYLTLLFSTALVSVALSSHATYLLLYTRFLEVALIILLFNAMRAAYNADTIVPFIRFLAWVLFYLSLFECAIAFLQFISQGPLGLKTIGECDLAAYAFPMQGAHRWLFDVQKTSDVLIRVAGTFPHPNIFGGFLFCALLNTMYLYFTQAKMKLILAGLFLQIPVLILTFSRAALIAFTLTAAVYLFLQIRNPGTHKRALRLILALFALGILCFSLFLPQLLARGGLFNYNTLVRGADTERLAYQNIAIEIIKEHPLLGVGLNSFQIESHRYASLPSRVHNIYLLIAAETGLIGLSFFCLFLFSLLKHARHALHTHEGRFLLMVFCGFLFIGCCDFYLFCTPHGQILFFASAASLYLSSSQLKLEKVCG